MFRSGAAKNRERSCPHREALPPNQLRLPLALVALSSTAIALAATLSPGNKPALAADPAPQDRAQLISEDPLVRAQLSRSIDKPYLGQLAMRDSSPQGGQVYPIPNLHRVEVLTSKDGQITLSSRPQFKTRLGDRYASLTPKDNFVFYTLQSELQEYVSSLVSRAQASHVAIVAMNPTTGAIMAMAGKSSSLEDLEYHAGFPAASLFKVVTAAAAVEHAGIASHSLIPFRGGTYTLNQANYYPDPRRDRRIMSVGEALGRSCNPVFGHLGVKYLNGQILERYANLFGFNRSLEFEAPLTASSAWIPLDNAYELSRTSAGFGDIRVSPIHAATLMSGIANGGMLPRPQLIDMIMSPDGTILHKQKPEALQRIVETSTAESLMEMMRHTTTIGTSRREFMRGATPTLGAIDVAGKTGTLSGDNPRGLNNWFIGAAPINNPQIALAVITVDPLRSSKASHLGRLILQKYFGVPQSDPLTSYNKPPKGSHKKAVKKFARRTTTYAKKPAKKKTAR